jgi:diaminopimelate decarboxylase
MRVVESVGGVSLAECAEQYGTPYYLYDRSVIEQRVAELTSRFSVVRYAQKANPHLAILGLMRSKGVVVDAVSAGEIARALRAGYTPDEIVYTADVFEHQAIRLLQEHPVGINCGSPDMLKQVAEFRPGAKVTLRINPGFGHGHSKKTDTGGPASKHGIWFEELPEVVRLAHSLSLTIEGLHMHIGSGSNFEHLSKVGDSLIEVDAGPDVRTLSAGGGLPTPYRQTDERIDLDRYYEVWEAHRRTYEAKMGHPVTLEVEPGRYPVAEAGWLVGKIWAIKKTVTFTFYLLDTGFNHLVRPAMYGAYHPMAVCPADGRKLTEVQPVAVAGPLCESGDVFTQEEGGVVVSQELPVARVGDLLVIGCAGAYGKAMASNYNSHPYPAELWVGQGRAELITPRQTLEEVIGRERIPESIGQSLAGTL